MRKSGRIMFSSLDKICILTYIVCSSMMIAMILTYFMPSYLFIIHNLCHFYLTTNYILLISGGYRHFWTIPDNFLYYFYLLFKTLTASISSITTYSIDSVFGFYNVYQFACNTLEHIYGTIVFWHNIANVVLLCVLIYKATSVCRYIH